MISSWTDVLLPDPGFLVTLCLIQANGSINSSHAVPMTFDLNLQRA